VRLGIPPYLADLELWGRDVGGEWWALVVWSVQVTPPDGTHAVPTGCAAWVPGLQVEQPLQPVDYLQVRRMQLPAEPADWPAPVDRPGAHWRGYYLGILDGAEPLFHGLSTSSKRPANSDFYRIPTATDAMRSAGAAGMWRFINGLSDHRKCRIECALMPMSACG
jgi:hypothetical protein